MTSSETYTASSLHDAEMIHMHWWVNRPNFGDLLSPWLAEKISGKRVTYAERGDSAIVAIGSILSHVSPGSVVWGTGAFGTETPQQICAQAEYRAVRGPLTRNKLANEGVACPRRYGDPALLVPRYYAPTVAKTHEVGIVLRWSESNRNQYDIPGVKKIFLGRGDIEGVLDDFLACNRIISTSLHGLIIADAYGIPNAWLDSHTPKGLEFKYWDYLISVGKTRDPQPYALKRSGVDVSVLMRDIAFDGRPIGLDLDALYAANPFV